MALTPATNRQVPDHSIMDAFNKQTYLGNQFIYSLNTESLATTETPFILLQNPAVAGSGFPSGYQALFVNLLKMVCLTASQNAVMRVYLNPTFSVAGTPATAIQARPASPTASISILTIAPTVSINGSLVNVLSSQPGISDSSALMVVLDPGQNLLITTQTSSNTTFIAPTIGWYQL